MKNLFLSGAAAICMLASCGNAATDKTAETNIDSIPMTDTTTVTTEPVGTQVAIANLSATADSTENIGTAKFYTLSDGQIRLDLEINMKQRADSNVAVHFHEHGNCGNMGENTHGHWNPTKEKHGKWGTPPFHSGDIGNIQLDANGHGTTSVTTNRWSVADTSKNYIIGRGIIVHGGTDDYTTQPTGNSGPRVGCGVIMKL